MRQRDDLWPLGLLLRLWYFSVVGGHLDFDTMGLHHARVDKVALVIFSLQLFITLINLALTLLTAQDLNNAFMYRSTGVIILCENWANRGLMFIRERLLGLSVAVTNSTVRI